MPNYSGWLSTNSRARDWRGEDDPRPAGVAQMIADKPAEITIIRGGTALDEQTVRIDVFGSSVNERLGMGSNAYTNTQRVLVLGYRNHDTIDDTDIQTQDEFAFDGNFYRVVKVESGFVDRVEAVAEATE